MLLLGFRLFAAQNPVATGGSCMISMMSMCLTETVTMRWSQGAPTILLESLHACCAVSAARPSMSDDSECFWSVWICPRSRADLLHICPSHSWTFSWMLADHCRPIILDLLRSPFAWCSSWRGHRWPGSPCDMLKSQTFYRDKEGKSGKVTTCK